MIKQYVSMNKVDKVITNGLWFVFLYNHAQLLIDLNIGHSCYKYLKLKFFFSKITVFVS